MTQALDDGAARSSSHDVMACLLIAAWTSVVAFVALTDRPGWALVFAGIAGFSMTQLFELTPAESMFAPFHDPAVAEQLPLRLEPGTATGLKRDFGWDGVKLSWDTAKAETVAATLEMPLVDLPDRFDHFVFCHVAPKDVSLTFEAKRGGPWTPLAKPVPGTGGRKEVTFAIGARPVDGVRCVFTALGGSHVMISLQWWGVARAALVAELDAARPRFDGKWEGLIVPPD